MTRTIRTALLAVVSAVAIVPASAGEIPTFAKNISARVIAAISDGDFAASSYRDGVLAPPERNFRDTLTILSTSDGKPARSEIEVSNSVTATPEILQLSPDGNTAFVVERLGQRESGATTVKDLPPGNRLFAIDLADKAAPRLAGTATIADFPEALSVDPGGTRIATVSNTPEASVLEITSYADGRFGDPARFGLSELGITGTASGPRGGVTATNVHWHPSGRFLAVNIDTQDGVAFFAVTEGEGGTQVRPWGAPVEVGKDPFTGRFTPDGRYYLTANWGRDFAASDLAGRLPRTPSEIAVVRLADLEGADEDARHELIGTTPTDLSSEGIAVSPDGALVATVNMRGTAFEPDFERFDREATVTLLSFDAQSGELAKVGDYPLEGVLPEGGTFDATGDHFIATVFEGHEGADGAKGSGLEVFRVNRGENPSLASLGRIPLAHGAHHVAIAR